MATITGLNPAFTWTVTGTPTTGTFVCGEPYVVDSGSGVELTAISPAPSGTGGTARNGSMVNPTTAYVHGWDGRAHSGTYFSPGLGTYNSNWSYADSRNVGLNLPYSLTSGKSLVSVKSKTDVQERAKVISDLAILTCIGSNPGSGNAFRPPFAGSTKPMWLKSQVDYGKLPLLTAPLNPITGNVLDFFYTDEQSGAYGWFDLPEDTPAWEATETWRPINHMNNYPTYQGWNMVRMALYAMCDWGGAEQTYANRLIQYGIDLYHVLILDQSRFAHGAGYGVGRMLPIMFAGYMLGDEDMLNVCLLASGRNDSQFSTPVGVFQELNVVHSSPGALKDYRMPLPLTSYSGGVPLYGDYWEVAYTPGSSPNNTSCRDPDGKYDGNRYTNGPYQYTDGSNVYLADGGSYMELAASVFVPSMLVIHILGLQSYLGPNWQKMMNFADRYANDPGMWRGFNNPDLPNTGLGPRFDYAGPNTAKGFSQTDYNYDRDAYVFGGGGKLFNAAMWDTYRYPGGRKLMGF